MYLFSRFIGYSVLRAFKGTPVICTKRGSNSTFLSDTWDFTLPKKIARHLHSKWCIWQSRRLPKTDYVWLHYAKRWLTMAWKPKYQYSPATNIDKRYLTKPTNLIWKIFAQFITWYNVLKKTSSKWPTFALIQRWSLLGHTSINVRTTFIEKLSTTSTSTCLNDSRLWWCLLQTMPFKLTTICSRVG